MRTLRERTHNHLEGAGLVIVLVTLWPRAARVLYPFIGRPPRRVLRNVLLWTAWLIVAREWIGPRATAAAERRERELEELAVRLGRKPTHDEVVEDYGVRRAERKAAKRGRSRARARWGRRPTRDP